MALKRRFPTSADVRAEAKRRLPNFAYEYCDGGAGGADIGIQRNNNAFDAIEMVPRYGKVVSPPPADCELFGRRYAAPIGVAPVGGPGTVYPGAETYLAKACQAAGVPYTLGLLSGITLDEAARLAPDVLWFQLYRFARNDHAIGFDLVKRADAAGVHVLMLTIDTPIRTTRTREVKSGIVTPFRLTTRLKLDALSSPHWTRALMRNGIPRFVNLQPYMNGETSIEAAAAFQQREGGGAFTWDEVARYRDKWKKPLMVKGVLHPEDAERAAALGLDGIVVSNHGGRQIEALPAPIDTLPAIAAAVGKEHDDHLRQRRSHRCRCRARHRARRRCVSGGQGVPLEPRRLGRKGAGAYDRHLQGRVVLDASACSVARRCASCATCRFAIRTPIARRISSSAGDRARSIAHG